MNYKRLLTKYERKLIGKMDSMCETHRLLSSRDKGGVDHYLNSEESIQANSMANQGNKHIMSMLPDMYIYENNVGAYEQKLMEGMRHE